MRDEAFPAGLRRSAGTAASALRRVSLGVALLLAGCQFTTENLTEQAFQPSRTPVTIDTVARNDRMAALARAQHPRILATYGGEYSDPKLERRIAAIVGRLAPAFRDQQTYQITILDSHSVNAFALPGGYLYVTRGLLTLANDSAEVAAVIAHEMGHVTANHGIERQRREAEEAIATRVVAEVLGDDPAARSALVRGKLRLAQFSRNQELEADAIGIRALGEAGFDPYAAPRFLKSMQAYSDFRSVGDSQDPSLDFLASHPAAPRRIELAERHARNFGMPGTGLRERDPYLDGIDGLYFGDPPEEGFVRGSTFLHPVLGIRFDVPSGFLIDNSAEAVTAAGPGDVAIRFDGVAASGDMKPIDYLRSGWVVGLEEKTVESITVNGMPGARGEARADGWRFDVTVVRMDDRYYRILTAAPLSNANLRNVAASVVSSFRRMTTAERTGIKPLRIRIVTARAGDTVASMASRMQGTDRKVALFRLLNALPPGATLSAGERVKIVSE